MPEPATPQTGQPTAPPNELASKVRAKFPGVYDDLDDGELSQKIVAKYPQYADLAPKTVIAGAMQTAPGAPVKIPPTPGNIDLYAQPKVKNADGSYSTVDSRSYGIDGREVLLPSVTPDGRHLKTDDEIVSEYHKTGRHLGKFNDPQEADAYATKLHNDYAAGKYDKKPEAAKPNPNGPTISPRTPTEGEQFKEMLSNSALGRAFGMQPTETAANPDAEAHRQQLIAPGAGIHHPGVSKGVAEFAGGLTTPGNLLLMAGTGGIGALEPIVGKVGVSTISKLISAGFSYQMLNGAIQQYPHLMEAIRRGDYPVARQIATEMGLSTVMAGAAFKHGATPEPTPFETDIENARNAPRATPEKPQAGPAAPISRQLNAAPKSPIVTKAPNVVDRSGPIPADEKLNLEGFGKREPLPESRQLNKAPVMAPPAREAPQPVAPRAEIVGKDAAGKPIYGSGPAKVVGYRAEGKTPIYEGYENEPEAKPKGKQKAPTINGRKAAQAAEGGTPKTQEGKPAAGGAATQEPAAGTKTETGAELKIVRQKMADLNKRISGMNYGAGMKNAIAQYRTLEARAEELQPKPKEVMAQMPATSKATPPGEGAILPEKGLPSELHSDMEKQAGRTLTPDEAVQLDRSNREVPQEKPAESTAILENRRTEVEKPPKPLPPLGNNATVTEEAKHQIIAAQDAWQAFERPAIKFSQPDFTTGNDRDTIREFTHATTSARPSMEAAFPWLRDLPKMTPKKLGDALERGKGAEYERLLTAAGEHIQKTREALAPAIEELKPTLDKLAQHGNPEIAEFAKQIQNGTFHTPENIAAFRKLIEEKVGEADATEEFFKDAESLHAGEPDEPGTFEPDEERPSSKEAPANEEAAKPVPPSNEPVAARSEPPPGKVAAKPLSRAEETRSQGTPLKQALMERRPEPEPEPQEPVTTEAGRAEGLNNALHSMQGATERWAKDRASGLSDEDLKKRIAFEMGQGGASRTGYSYETRGSEGNPTFKITAGGEGVLLSGRQLVKEARKVLNIGTEPKGENGDVLPGMAEHVEKQNAGAEATKTAQQIAEKQGESRSIESAAGEMETKSPLFRGTAASPQNEMFSGKPAEEKKPTPSNTESMQGFGTKLTAGVDPAMVRAAFRRINDWYDQHIANPFIEDVLKTGRTHKAIEDVDPGLASRLRVYEAGGVALRAQAEANAAKVINGIDRAQERLFVLMADKMSRENLEQRHPEEYAKAISDPAIMKSLERYAKLDKELSTARAALGGQNLEGEHLRWNYPEHVAGINKKITATEGMPSATLNEVIKPQRADKFGRTTTPEYHYQNGLHEFGPAYSKMYVSTMGKLQEHAVASHFMANATKLTEGDPLPPVTSYAGKLYYRPDIVQMIRQAKPGAESRAIAEDLGVEELPKPKEAAKYAVYDPKAGQAGTQPNVRYIGPEPIVEAMNGMGKLDEGKSSPVAQFIRQQIVGMGFGVPHYMNILRRVIQSNPAGHLSPAAWAEASKVLFSKELKARGISGAEDPQFAALLKWGGVSPMGIDHYRQYVGGNFNPANWAKIGHDLLFSPGGIDQRARLWVADNIKAQEPGISSERAAQLVNDAVGRYNRSTWTDRMKMVHGYMVFPGWDFSSINWAVRHPIKTTLPPAILVMLANQALNKAGMNQPEDRWDPFNVHVGRRTYGTALLTEPLARRMARPLIRTAAGIVGGEAPSRAISEGARSIPGAAAAGLSMGLPSVTLPVEMGTNKKIGGGDVVAPGDWERPGTVLPNKGLEDELLHAAGTVLPQAGRVASTIAETPEKQDIIGALSSNLGVSTQRQDPLTRLAAHATRANEAIQLIREGKQQNPEQLRARLASDPDLAFYARERGAIASLIEARTRLEAAEERATTPELKKQLEERRAALANAAEQFNQRFEEAKVRHREATQ